MATPALLAPKSDRRAGIPQGLTLVASAWVSVFASGALLGPVLPRMTEYFRAEPHVDVMIALVATLPALFVAFLSMPFGILAGRVGHHRVMFWASMFYGAAGILPYWLRSLTSIVISRSLVGITEAAVMICGVTLIGGYFSSVERDRWYAVQAGSGPIAAIAAVLLGGVLGEANWRVPFLVYGFGFVLFILVATLLWEPQQGKNVNRESTAETAVNWPRIWGICALSVFAMSAFLVPVIQAGFLLAERGISSPQSIGMWGGVSSLANVLGALAFGVSRARHIAKAALSLAVMAAGFAIIGLQPTWQAAVVGIFIAKLGCGMILPTLITWALLDVPPGIRGTVTGAWMGASFLGQFLSPLTVIWFKGLTSNLSQSILVYAIACAVAAAGTVIGARRTPSILRGHALNRAL